ncbi:xylulokinase [Rhodobium gokarnense]|uniref:Xylulose kinase n=1 Tax=Rhodobium gokarnense TaxID=364296 RepID=A0ABT3HHM9_9HYPH|nr:xylulokinase [Rhodobium gokarnense]MCW2309814.1 xylulokinase [Rhodobium gokarnense]
MYLGIDIGTSSVKTVLIDAGQTVLASATSDLTVSRPQSGWSEQTPDDWWRATLATIDSIAKSHPKELSAVAGIGLSGQMHGATLLDVEDNVLRPAILWNDGRSAAECRELEERCPSLRAIAGNIAMPGFTAPKIEWVRKHEPEVYGKIAKVLLPKDYVRLQLAGVYASDMSDAAGTLWLDVAGRCWSDELLDATGLDESQMPTLAEGTEPTGGLRDELRERWGITGEVVIAGGGGDNAASACGMGTITPGSAFLSLGTSGVLFVSNASFAPNTDGAVHAFCHAVPDTWHQMGVILSATDSLNWLATLTGRSAPELTAEAGMDVEAPSPVVFLPYLSGERTPHNDADARGVFVGIDHSCDRAVMTRAVMEGVGYAFRDCLRVLNAAGTDISSALAVGGGARSALWLKIAASILNRPLEIPHGGETGAAFGAARLGLVAATGADPTEVCTKPDIEAVVEPDAALAARYDDGYGRYRALYPAIKEVMSK